MPIVKLLKDQELVLEAVAVLGKGLNHMKFSPGLVIYRGFPELIVKKESDIKQFLDKCLGGLCKIDGRKIEILDVLKWNEACFDYAKENNIDVKLSEEDFVFLITSWGQFKKKKKNLKAVENF